MCKRGVLAVDEIRLGNGKGKAQKGLNSLVTGNYFHEELAGILHLLCGGFQVGYLWRVLFPLAGGSLDDKTLSRPFCVSILLLLFWLPQNVKARCSQSLADVRNFCGNFLCRFRSLTVYLYSSNNIGGLFNSCTELFIISIENNYYWLGYILVIVRLLT